VTIASLIVDVAANQVQLIRDVEQIQGSMDKIGKIAKTAGAAIAAAFTVDKVIDAGRRVIDYASHISDLSDRLHISTTTAQQWEAAFGKSGISLETVAKAAEQLSVKLVGGDKGAVAALGKLGFNLTELKNMSPEARFNAVADAIGRIQNPAEQLYASKTLLGKGGAELLGALDGHLQQTIDQLTAMGVVIDEHTIKAADDFGDQLGVLEKVGLALIAQVLVPILPGLMSLAQWLSNLASGAMRLAQSLEDTLIRKFLEAKAAILEWAYGIGVASQNIPLLGKYIGVSAGTLDTLRNSAAEAHDQVKIFSTVVHTSTESTKKHTAALIGLGGAMDTTTAAGSKLAEQYKKEMETSTKRVEMIEKIEKDMYAVRIDLETRFYKQQQDIAFAAGQKILADTLALNQSLISLDAERTRNLLAVNVPQMTAGANQAGTLGAHSFMDGLIGTSKGMLGGLNDIFQRAFEGGGGALGAIKSFATKGIAALMSMIPGVGPFLAQFAGAITAGLSKIFGGLFGGPDANEKAGRSATDSFAQQMSGTLDWMQQIEVHTAVANGASQKWAETMIGVRDAYLKAGHSAAEADDVVRRLFEAEKRGGGAVQQVIDEITRAMHDTLPSALDATGAAGERAFEGISRAAEDALAVAEKVDQQTTALYQHMLQLRGFNGGSAGEGTSDDRNASGILSGLSENQAMNAYLRGIANTGSNEQDWDRVKSQYGFAGGTHGAFLDFGAGTPVTLHGRERVMTEAEGRGGEARLRATLSRIDRTLSNLPRTLRDAMLLAPA
jgi:hypothetical protein